MVRCPVADENDTEVTPAFGPELIHLNRRSSQAEKMLVVLGVGHSAFGVTRERADCNVSELSKARGSTACTVGIFLEIQADIEPKAAKAKAEDILDLRFVDDLKKSGFLARLAGKN